jgi:hypothetical protein
MPEEVFLINSNQNLKRFDIIGDYLPTKANDRMKIRSKIHDRKGRKKKGMEGIS